MIVRVQKDWLEFVAEGDDRLEITQDYKGVVARIGLSDVPNHMLNQILEAFGFPKIATLGGK